MTQSGGQLIWDGRTTASGRTTTTAADALEVDVPPGHQRDSALRRGPDGHGNSLPRPGQDALMGRPCLAARARCSGTLTVCCPNCARLPVPRSESMCTSRSAPPGAVTATSTPIPPPNSAGPARTAGWRRCAPSWRWPPPRWDRCRWTPCSWAAGPHPCSERSAWLGCSTPSLSISRSRPTPRSPPRPTRSPPRPGSSPTCARPATPGCRWACSPRRHGCWPFWTARTRPAGRWPRPGKRWQPASSTSIST